MPPPAHPQKLSASLRGLLAAHGDRDITIAELIQAMGKSSFGLLILVLALPSALPVPAPGYSTPFGIVLFLLGMQLVAGRATPWLPRWALKIQIKRRIADKMLEGAARFFAKVEHLIKPRFAWAMTRSGLICAGGIVMFMAALMAIPLPGTNTAPAMVIFLTAIALTERDGLLLIAASVAGIFAALLYTALLIVIATYGAAGVSEAKEMIREWLR